jgi:hypothetical protein
MPDYPPQLNSINGWINSNKPALDTMQDDYLVSHGRYMQAIRSHSVIPTAGSATQPDQLNSKPHYQAESLQSLGVSHGPLEFAYEIHQHVGPLGAGWTMILRSIVAGVTWIRRIGNGFHAITHDWQVG